MAKGKTIPKAKQLAVWTRDNWTCRYCGDAVFFVPTLKLLNNLSQGHGYYHPNGKADMMLSLFQWKWASVDHIEPRSKGGSDSEDNYATACWNCNLKWGNKTFKDGKPQPNKINENVKTVKWDGFSSLYLTLSPTEDEWVKLLKKNRNYLTPNI